MLRRVSILLVVMLLLSGAYASSPSQSEPKGGTTPSDETAALQKRIADLEAQLKETSERAASLQAENDVLRSAIATIRKGRQESLPEGATPFEYNGMRFYVIPAAPAAADYGRK